MVCVAEEEAEDETMRGIVVVFVDGRINGFEGLLLSVLSPHSIISGMKRAAKQKEGGVGWKHHQMNFFVVRSSGNSRWLAGGWEGLESVRRLLYPKPTKSEALNHLLCSLRRFSLLSHFVGGG